MTKRKMILIDESELKSLIKDAVNDAVDNITKKIAAQCATLSYNNKIFNNEDDDDDISSYGGCGNISIGSSCGSSRSSRSSRSSYGYGCGSGPSTGGC